MAAVARTNGTTAAAKRRHSHPAHPRRRRPATADTGGSCGSSGTGTAARTPRERPRAERRPSSRTSRRSRPRRRATASRASQDDRRLTDEDEDESVQEEDQVCQTAMLDPRLRGPSSERRPWTTPAVTVARLRRRCRCSATMGHEGHQAGRRRRTVSSRYRWACPKASRTAARRRRPRPPRERTRGCGSTARCP